MSKGLGAARLTAPALKPCPNVPFCSVFSLIFLFFLEEGKKSELTVQKVALHIVIHIICLGLNRRCKCPKQLLFYKTRTKVVHKNTRQGFHKTSKSKSKKATQPLHSMNVGLSDLKSYSILRKLTFS